MRKSKVGQAMEEVMSGVYEYIPEEDRQLVDYVRTNKKIKVGTLRELGYTVQQANKILRRFFGLEIKAYYKNAGTHYRLIFYYFADVQSLKPSRLPCRQNLNKCFTTCYAAATCPAAKAARPGIGERFKRNLNTEYKYDAERT